MRFKFPPVLEIKKDANGHFTYVGYTAELAKLVSDYFNVR